MTKTASLTPQSNCCFRLVLTAFGTQDVDDACKFTIPSVMAPLNLPDLDLQSNGKVPVTVCCLKTDRHVFEQSQPFAEFAKDRRVDWYFVDSDFARSGGALEPLLADVFRDVMHSVKDDDGSCALLLFKPRTIVADGSLAFVAEAVRRGALAVLVPTLFGSREAMLRFATDAGDFKPRSLVRNYFSDAAASASSFSGLGTSGGFAGSDRLATYVDGYCNQIMITARWHPLALRPSKSSQSRRQSLLDAEIIPEFADNEDDIVWAKDSDQALCIGVQPEAWLARRFDANDLTEAEVVARIHKWATPWQVRALATRYRIVSRDVERADADLDAPFAGLTKSVAEGISPERHPIWLASRGLRLVSQHVAVERRYQSHLDEYYRVSRQAIERAAVQEIIYIGFAGHVFVNLMVRAFERAYFGDFERLLSEKSVAFSISKTTLCVVHIDLRTFIAEFLFGPATLCLQNMLSQGLTCKLLVESPDSQGGMTLIDSDLWRRWYEALKLASEAANATCGITSTIVNFFHGHPGFVVELDPCRRTEAFEGSAS